MIIKEAEKRKFTRLAISIPFSYKIRGLSEFGSGLAKDISVGGLRFITDRYIKPLTDIMFELNVLSKTISSVGRIKWSQSLSHSDKYQMGLEFIELESNAKNYLSDYINLRRFRA